MITKLFVDLTVRFIPKRRMETVCATKRKLSEVIESELGEGEKKIKQDVKEIFHRVKCQKYAMYLSFCGKGYYGMQIQQNSEFPTVEREVFNALRKVNLIKEEALKQSSDFSFQRASRTDKDVSAVKQMCSLALPREQHENLEKLVETMNSEHLPVSMKIWGFTRVTKSFDAKCQSDNRTYSYTCPTFAFAHVDELTQESFRLPPERLSEINRVLSTFIGTKNYFNFTSNRKPGDKSCNRFIMSFQAGEPFERGGLEFVTFKVRGQSFMLHQIRKMIGVVIPVIRGLVDKSYIEQALSPELKTDVPKAPGLGLILEEVHFDRYNKRFEATHEKLSWEKYDEEIKTFRERFIDSVIVETEKTEKPMFQWLSILPLHRYEPLPPGVTNNPTDLYKAKLKCDEEAAQMLKDGNDNNDASVTPAVEENR